MTTLRVGTRGSDLALVQTRWACDRLRAAHPGLVIEQVVVRTHGDRAADAPFDASWPAGGFVTALEEALLAGEVDLAVHSHKDLPSRGPAGLVVAAVPEREVAHDVLVARRPCDLGALPRGFRVGTSSPRRAAQMRRAGDVEIVAIRGNVPARLARLDSEDPRTGGLDAIVLAAAGLKRLGLDPPHLIALPPERFVPAPGQGALALQTRSGSEAEHLARVLDDPDARRAVTAERAFLARAEAGCRTALGAWAVVRETAITLRAQIFCDDGTELREGTEHGEEAEEVGERLAERLLRRGRERARE